MYAVYQCKFATCVTPSLTQNVPLGMKIAGLETPTASQLARGRFPPGESGVRFLHLVTISDP
jgi:hypothetical protein